MTDLTLFVPALVQSDADVVRLCLQALIRDRLAPYLPGWRVRSVLVVDATFPPHRDDLEGLEGAWDHVVWPEALQRPAGDKPTGVRCPTENATVASGVRPDLYMRVIQDCHLVDPSRLARDLLAFPIEGLSLGGLVTDSDHLPSLVHTNEFLDELGVPRAGDLVHVQGALMVAPPPVWDRYYRGLPRSLVHFFDDTVMSKWLEFEGGSLVPFAESFEHLHDAPCPVLGPLLWRHRREIDRVCPDSQSGRLVDEVLRRLPRLAGTM